MFAPITTSNVAPLTANSVSFIRQSVGMSYSAYWSRVPMAWPQGLGVALGGWLLLNVYNGKPRYMTREISKGEFDATPFNYLQNPEHHYVAFPKVPGQTSVEDGLGDLQHKAHAKGHH